MHFLKMKVYNFLLLNYTSSNANKDEKLREGEVQKLL